MRDAIIWIAVRVGWSLVKWWWDRANREIHARAIAELFKKVQAEGDDLFNQLGQEMSRQSDTPWIDIQVRGTDDIGGDKSIEDESIPASESKSDPGNKKGPDGGENPID